MFQFTEDCLIGISQLDEDHRKLFLMVNQIYQLLKDDKTTIETADMMIGALKEYTQTHFIHEESYMEQIQDPELPRQRREHADFAAKMEELDISLWKDQDSRKTMEDLLQYLARYMYHHILGSDTMIGKIPVREKACEDPFAFTDRYKTGIPLIDEEHKRLFAIIKETDYLIHAQHLHDKYDEIVKILSELRDYTVLHFHDEEAYMEQIQYQGLRIQRLAHESFIDKLDSISLDDIDANQEQYLMELVDFLLGWLINHILKVDKLIPPSPVFDI